ncbi:MAG: methyl-accepting chemotaxis protein [Pseudobdellovibrionaceae bacterium]
MKLIASFLKGIKGRITILTFITLLSLTVVSLISVSTANFQKKTLNEFAHKKTDRMIQIADLLTIVQETQSLGWTIIGEISDSEQSKKNLEDFTDRQNAISKSIQKLIGLGTETEATQFKKLEEIFNSLSDATQKLGQLVASHQEKETYQHMKLVLVPLVKSIIKVVEEIKSNWEMDLYGSVGQVMQQTEHRLLLLYILSGVGALVNIIIGLYIGIRLTKSLTEIALETESNFEDILITSQQLNSASQTLSSASTQSASSLEETVSALEEISSTVKLNAENAREAATLSQKTDVAATEGEVEIRKLIQAMSDIASGSKKIEEIINVIDDIAFQTNLLALNAAVEAARAGEQGKGFAVVAEAVRALAQRSAGAAKNITDLIKDSTQKSARGSLIADRSEDILKNIVVSVKRVSDLNSEISIASQEQSRGINQISKVMNELDQATQKNAMSAEELANSGQSLTEQADKMKDVTIKLSAIITGENSMASVANDSSDVIDSLEGLPLKQAS